MWGAKEYQRFSTFVVRQLNTELSTFQKMCTVIVFIFLYQLVAIFSSIFYQCSGIFLKVCTKVSRAQYLCYLHVTFMHTSKILQLARNLNLLQLQFVQYKLNTRAREYGVLCFLLLGSTSKFYSSSVVYLVASAYCIFYIRISILIFCFLQVCLATYDKFDIGIVLCSLWYLIFRTTYCIFQCNVLSQLY